MPESLMKLNTAGLHLLSNGGGCMVEKKKGVCVTILLALSHRETNPCCRCPKVNSNTASLRFLSLTALDLDTVWHREGGGSNYISSA